MARVIQLPAARRFRPGSLRPVQPGTTLRCLVLASGPEWVAVDVDSGALLRPLASSVAHGAPLDLGPSLSTVSFVIDDSSEPFDPSRPEAVGIAPGSIAGLGAPRRRAVRQLLGKLVTRSPAAPLLGSLGPSVAYSDLEGDRPSVVLVEPDHRPRFGNGPTGPWCQFSLGDRKHALPLHGRPEDATSRTGDGRTHRSSRRRRHGPGAAVPRLLVVGFGAPRGGQVPKVVLGAISEPPRR